MSHTSKHKQKVTQIETFKTVLAEKGIKFKEACTVSLYGSNRVKAELAFKLPGWKYECALNKDGEIQYDHYGSPSGSFAALGEVIQDYNVAAVMEKAWLTASNVWTETLKNGAKKVVLEF